MSSFALVEDGPGRGRVHIVNEEGRAYCGRHLGKRVEDAALLMTIAHCVDCRVMRRRGRDDNWSGKE